MKLTPSLTVVLGMPLDWHGYRLACPECGSSDRWALRAGTYSQWDTGESAEAECPNGHVLRTHPLVYPQFVRALKAAGEEAGRTGSGQLDVGDWHPHFRTERDGDLDGFANLRYVVDYLSWHQTGHLPAGWWPRQWPGLVQAAREAGVPVPYWIGQQAAS